jgi:hypothetical protein
VRLKLIEPMPGVVLGLEPGVGASAPSNDANSTSANIIDRSRPRRGQVGQGHQIPGQLDLRRPVVGDGHRPPGRRVAVDVGALDDDQLAPVGRGDDAALQADINGGLVRGWRSWWRTSVWSSAPSMAVGAVLVAGQSAVSETARPAPARTASDRGDAVQNRSF